MVLIAWLDFWTPPYIFLIGFYLLPIYLAIWYCSRALVGVVLGISLPTSLYMAALNIPPTEPFWERTLAYISVVIVLIGFVLVMTGLKKSFGRLLEENQTDALTGLRSRRNFIEMASFEISRATRSAEPMTLALVDLDNFKHINDTQGHAAGDALLVAASRCMTSAVRNIDIVGRLGGDEFVILLPGTDVHEGTRVLERLHANLRTLLQSFSPRVTASVGAVTLSAEMDISVADVLDKADAVMYSVKSASKDGVIVRPLFGGDKQKS